MTFSGFKVVLAGQDVSEDDLAHHWQMQLAVRALSRARLPRAAILLDSPEIFGFQDWVCCIGESNSGQLTPFCGRCG